MFMSIKALNKAFLTQGKSYLLKMRLKVPKIKHIFPFGKLILPKK